MTYLHYSMTSEDGNQQMYNQMVHNILETLKTVATQHNFVRSLTLNYCQTEEEAFEKIFFDWSPDHVIREQLIEGTSEVSMYEHF